MAREQWQKKLPWLVILSDSEESRALMGQIINKIQLHSHYSAALLSVGILPRPKARSEWQWRRIGSFRITKKEDWLVNNDKKQPGVSFWAIAKNPAYSLNESCLKGDKIFTTQTFTHIPGILPRPKSAFRMTMNEDWLVNNDKKQPGMSFWAIAQNPAHSWDKSCLKHFFQSYQSNLRTLCRDSSSLKSSFRMTNQDNCPNPTLTQAVGILPRPKARSEWQRRRIGSFRKTKTPRICHSERSEESRVLMGRIINKIQLHFILLRRTTLCRDSSSPKSSFRMTMNEDWLVNNDKKQPGMSFWAIAQNPAYSLNESCLKGDKIFTTQTFTHIPGILPRPKARSEWQW
jgi:hypothetical protein